MAWARTYMKKYGLVENSERGVWSLTLKGKRAGAVDPDEVVKHVRSNFKARPKKPSGKGAQLEVDEDVSEADDWKTQLNAAFIKMAPDAFERLCQRLLRECGFIEVTVTGRSGDGGIDGTGVIRLQNVVSYQVLFQSKKWQGSVPPKEIRDFRGAMAGRTDKGIFITTGTYTSEARKEATRDGAPPIDLIDGERLAELMKQMRLGVKTETVERVIVDDEWFESL